MEHGGTNKKQMTEEALAARYMKTLTGKYGSKGKTQKQYFLEAYDEDYRLEIKDDDKVHHYDAKGREVAHHAAASRMSRMTMQDVFERHDRPCSPIVFQSVDDMLGLEQPEAKDSEKFEEPSRGFWASLERLEAKNLNDNSQLSLCDPTPPPSVDDAADDQEEDEDGQDDEASSSDSEDEFVAPIREATLDKYLAPVQEVVESTAVRRAWARVTHHLEQCKVRDPYAYELLGSIYDETRDFVRLPEDDVQDFEEGGWEPMVSEPETLFKLEPAEKLMGRFGVYDKAFLYMIEHFETLRPLLMEIKQVYSDVLDRAEKESKDLDKIRLNHIRLREAYANHVRQKDKEGDRTLMEVRLQILALQEHLQWQQHTLHVILGVLSKMRHSLKMQSRSVQKTSAKYKNKVELLAKEIVNQQAQTMFEMTSGKYTEMMAKFKNIKDGKELRRLLNGARRALSKVHKQIVFYETEFD